MHSDPTGYFWDYILDAVFIGIGIYDFIKNPSWGKAGWLLLDIVLAVVPFIPSFSSIRHLGKVDNIFDFSKLFRKVDNISDVGAAVATGYNIQTWIGLASLGSICLLASNNRPRNNRAQNKQFEQAAKSSGYDVKDPKVKDELNKVHQYIRKHKLNLGWKELLRLIKEWLG